MRALSIKEQDALLSVAESFDYNSDRYSCMAIEGATSIWRRYDYEKLFDLNPEIFVWDADNEAALWLMPLPQRGLMRVLMILLFREMGTRR